jgi:multiple sugar transport system permease protein
MSSSWRAARHLVSLFIAALFVLPLFWVVVASLRQPGLPPPPSIEWWPPAPQWGNYAEIFQIVPFARYLQNSLFVVAFAVPITLVTASLAGFAIVQLPATLQRRLVLLSIALLIVPASSVWLFRFQLLRWTGLLDTLWALIVPAFAASNPLFVLLFYWTFRQIPLELFEAARLDGASALTVWRRVAMPLALPTSLGVVVLTFVLYWSDFVSPVLYLHHPLDYTLPVGLQILNQLDSTNWPLLMAGAVVMTAPVIVLFAVLQRFFLHDMSLANLFGRN